MSLSVPLGETLEVKWVDTTGTNDLDYLILDGVTIWEKTIPFTATATYNRITKSIDYEITGDRISAFTKWSTQATRQSDGTVQTGYLVIGEEFVTDGSTSFSGAVGVDHDGTWDVTFKGYIDDNVRGEASATVTVATPKIEIISIQAL